MLSEKEFRADRLNVKHLKLDGVDISNFNIETLGDGKYIDSLRGDIQVNITPSMLNANGEYVIEQLPGLGRFKKVEVSMVSKPVYYLAPNGLDTNLGTKESPWQTLSKVPDNSIVVLLNGTYNNWTNQGQYVALMNCFFVNGWKSNLDIIGESKTGVIINKTNTPYNDDTLWVYLYNCTVSNMTINVADRGDTYYARSFNIECRYTGFHNITFNITGTWAYAYLTCTSVNFNACTMNGGTYVASSVGNNSGATLTYTVTNDPTQIPTLNLNNTGLTLNGTKLYLDNEASNTVYNYMRMLPSEISSNTLTFNIGTKRNFRTITLNLWLEQ